MTQVTRGGRAQVIGRSLIDRKASHDSRRSVACVSRRSGRGRGSRVRVYAGRLTNGVRGSRAPKPVVVRSQVTLITLSIIHFVNRCKPGINGDDHAIRYGTAEANGLSYIITTVVDGLVLIDGMPSTTTMVSHQTNTSTLQFERGRGRQSCQFVVSLLSINYDIICSGNRLCHAGRKAITLSNSAI